MLHPLEQVRDHQNPLADTTALASCQAPQLDRPRFAAKEICRHRPFPQTWYVCLFAIPHLGITGSQYYCPARPKEKEWAHDQTRSFSCASAPRPAPRCLTKALTQLQSG